MNVESDNHEVHSVSRPSSKLEAPLSNEIAAHVAAPSQESWERFLHAFFSSQVGVLVEGLPDGTAGDFKSTSEHPISVGLTRHAGGRAMALAFADPDAFAIRFGRPFNAALTGEALLATVLLNPECEGILINSALTEISITIDRATAETLTQVDTKPQSRAQPWWRRWWPRSTR